MGRVCGITVHSSVEKPFAITLGGEGRMLSQNSTSCKNFQKFSFQCNYSRLVYENDVLFRD